MQLLESAAQSYDSKFNSKYNIPKSQQKVYFHDTNGNTQTHHESSIYDMDTNANTILANMSITEEIHNTQDYGN